MYILRYPEFSLVLVTLFDLLLDPSQCLRLISMGRVSAAAPRTQQWATYCSRISIYVNFNAEHYDALLWVVLSPTFISTWGISMWSFIRTLGISTWSVSLFGHIISHRCVVFFNEPLTLVFSANRKLMFRKLEFCLLWKQSHSCYTERMFSRQKRTADIIYTPVAERTLISWLECFNAYIYLACLYRTLNCTCHLSNHCLQFYSRRYWDLARFYLDCSKYYHILSIAELKLYTLTVDV